MRAAPLILAFAAVSWIGYCILTAPAPPAPPHAACHGVTVDDAEADRQRKAAEAGDARAQYQAGLMALYGRDAKPDPQAAIAWLEKAAEQGDADAQYKLGDIYGGSTPGIKDVTKKKHYLRLAAAQGQKEAIFALSFSLGLGPLPPPGEPAPTPEEIEEAKVWGGRHYLVANGVAYHAKDAPFNAAHIARVRKKAEAGDAVAQYQISMLLRAPLATGMANDEKQAASWIEKSVAQEYTPAMRMLSDLIWKEERARSLALLNRAAELGDAEAMSSLALKYMPWPQTDEDYAPPPRDYPEQPAKALELYMKAAKLGDPDALMSLGRIFWKGSIGMPKDPVLAYALMTRGTRKAKTRGWSWMSYECDQVALEVPDKFMSLARKQSLEWPNGNYPPPPPPPR